MRHRRSELSLEEKERFIDQIKQGVSPTKLAKEYGMAISTVHNYKRKAVEAGIQVPVLKKGAPALRQPGQNPVQPNNHNTNQLVGIVAQGDKMNFIVNGVNVQIENSAKTVSIGRTGISVEF